MKINGIEVVEGKTIYLDPNLIKKGIAKAITKKQAKKIQENSGFHGIYEVSVAPKKDNKK